jgi:hypothetical protein
VYKEIILSKIKEYCRLKKIDFHGLKTINLHCVLCDSPGRTAMIMPNSATIVCHNCHPKDGARYYNLIDVARKVENKPDATDEEILTMLRTELNLNVATQKDETDMMSYLEKFEKRGWCLVPCARAAALGAVGNDKHRISTGKEPIQKDWQKIQNRDKNEWFHWLNSGLNIGVRTGEVSNLAIIDLDFLTKEEKVELVKESTTKKRREEIEAKKVIPAEIQAIMGEPLMQKTLGGIHLCYLATDLPKGSVDLFGVHLDIETEGGQVLIYPSFHTAVTEEFKEKPEDNFVSRRVVGFAKRQWVNDVSLTKIPQALYDLLTKSRVKAPALPADEALDKEIAEAIKDESLKVKDFKNNRTNTLIKVGGILRKSSNILQVRNSLSVFNNCIFDDPLPKQEFDHVIESIDKYIDDNEAIISRSILEFMNETDVASKMDVELAVFGKRAVGEEKLRLEKALMNLILKHQIVKFGLRNYKIVKKMPVGKNLCNVGVPINFKMPYFEDYAHFNKGDLVLIGSQTKFGKTTLAINFIKRLVMQALKSEIIYLYNENGSRFAKTALHLGMKEGDFGYVKAPNPMEIILEPNTIYIYDWIRCSDFAKTADVFDSIAQKLDEVQSTMIGFVQLREDNSWFAKDLLRQFVALSAKYTYTDKNGIFNKFELNDLRDRKASGKQYSIACKYIEETREVKMQDEIEEEERAEQTKKDFKNAKSNESNPNNQAGTGNGTGS